MCTPPSLYPAELEFFPSLAGGDIVEGIFDVRFRYEGSQDWQHLLCVHIPESARSSLKRGEVAGLNLAYLERNSPAARAFDFQPRSVVMGFRRRDGISHECVPSELVRTFWGLAAKATLALVVGTALAVATRSMGLAAATGAMVTYYTLAASRVPRKPSS